MLCVPLEFIIWANVYLFLLYIVVYVTSGTRCYWRNLYITDNPSFYKVQYI